MNQSTIIWHTATKTIFNAQPHNRSNTLDLVCAKTRKNPSDYTATLVDGSYHTKTAKDSLYVDDSGNIIKKQANPTVLDLITINANSVDVATLSNIPNPAVVTVNNVDYNETTGIFEITSQVPKVFHITVKSNEHLTKNFTVEAI